VPYSERLRWFRALRKLLEHAPDPPAGPSDAGV
jgi:hypothetical protein